MTLPTSVHAPIAALFVMAVLLAPRAADAQAVGSGPLTGSLADTEPVTGVLSFARIKFAPGVVIREMGWDSNVFDEPENPKEDYVLSMMPDVSAFSRLRFVQLSAYAGMDLNYFKTYDDESSTGHSLRGRVDFLLSRLKPFIGGGHTEMRTRPNGEIDVRADRLEQELSGGVGFDLSQYSSLYVAGNVFDIAYADAFEEGINLSLALNHRTTSYSAGVRTALTPLLTMTVSGSYSEDEFTDTPLRDSTNYWATAAFRIAPEAIVTGFANVSYRDFKPVDPAVEPYRGMTGQAGLSYSFLEVGRLGLTANRAIEYSFDEAEAYYVEDTIGLSYTHRLGGGVDAQARGARSWFDYGRRETTPAHTDTLDVVGASLGYNLANRTRISVNYEHSRRRSPALAERNYDRRRAYLAWAYAF